MQANPISFDKETFITRTPGKITDKFIKDKEISVGSRGKVFRVKNKSTGEYFVCKQLIKSKITDMKKLDQEISIMSKADHPNIIRLYEVYENNRYINLIMEECVGGELFERIAKRIENHLMFNEKQAANIIAQIMSAVSYCHSQGICHKALKPDNILYSTKDDNSPLKVIDFGLSSIFKPSGEGGEKKLMTNQVGTAYYVSPEIIQGSYDERCDIWSVGVILYILLCGYPPFNGPNDNEIYKKILNMDLKFPEDEWSNISDDAKDLLRHMICGQNARYTAAQVLEHKWVKKCAPDSKGNINDLSIQNLHNFKNASKIKKAMLTFIATRLKDKEIEKFKDIFMKIDKNKDGTLTLDEMRQGLSTILQKDEIDEIFKSIDSNNTGKIDYTEFLAASIDQKLYLREERLMEVFQMIDKNNSGKISKKEIKKALKLEGIDDESLKKVTETCDLNGDGEIDYNEFIDMMNKE